MMEEVKTKINNQDKVLSMLLKEPFEVHIATSLAKTPVPLIRTRHIVVPVRNNYLNRYLFNRKTAKVITVAETIRKNYFNNGSYDLSKIFTIHDGVDIGKLIS